MLSICVSVLLRLAYVRDTTRLDATQVLAIHLSTPFLVRFCGDQMASVLPYCDYVFGTESAARAFGEKQGWGMDVATVALKLAGEKDADDSCRKHPTKKPCGREMRACKPGQHGF